MFVREVSHTSYIPARRLAVCYTFMIVCAQEADKARAKIAEHERRLQQHEQNVSEENKQRRQRREQKDSKMAAVLMGAAEATEAERQRREEQLQRKTQVGM